MTLSNYPNELPAITLDFQNSRQLDPRISFSRASAASPDSSAMVNGKVMLFDANVPRLSDKGLLIEESRTNLFTTSGWTLNNQQGTNIVITQNSTDIVAPDGTFTATHITADSTNYVNNQFVGGNTLSNGKKITYSFWIYPQSIDVRNTPTTDAIRPRIGAGLANGAGAVSPIIPLEMNKWQRISLTTNQANDGAGTIQPSLLRDQNNVDIYVWGLQMENGDTMTSLIPSNGAQTTRAADLALWSGEDFLPYFNKYNFSAVLSIDNPQSPVDCFNLSNAGSRGDKERLNTTGNNWALASQGGASVTSTEPYVSNVPAKMGMSLYSPGTNGYQDSDLTIAVNNTASATNNSGTAGLGNPSFPINQFRFYGYTDQRINGYYKLLTFYATAFTQDQLLALTT